jgi:pimeloyl-ACP methyl ester carboxylesterase
MSAAFPLRHWRKLSITIVLLIVLAGTASIFYGADQITSPPRRKIMAYHREFLDHPAGHGMRIESSTSTSVPYLVCFPDPGGSLGARGLKIREQMTAKAFPLAPPGKVIGNLVLLHGRTGRKEDYLPIAERLCAAGFRCIIPDLPAHGDNPYPVTTYGALEVMVPEGVLDDAAREFRFDPQPAGLMGMSMGGSFAVHSAGMSAGPWKALVVLCSFDALEPVVEAQAAGYVGNGLAPLWAEAIGERYQKKTSVALRAIKPARLAGNIRIPTLIAHGSKDRVIPIAAGRRLYDALPPDIEKRWVEVPGAGHDNLLVTDYPIYPEIAEWFLRRVP